MNHHNHREPSIEHQVSSIEHRVSGIENPTLAHFRHLSSLFTNLPSTTVEDSLQISPFYAKQTQFSKSQMNVNSFSKKDYENKCNWTLSQNKPNSNPNKPNLSQLKPISMPIKPNSNPKQTQSKPVLSAVEWANLESTLKR